VLIDMRASGVLPNIITYSAALTACRAGGAPAAAAAFAEWQTMLDSGVRPDARCYTALFRLCDVKAGRWQHAAAAWQHLQQQQQQLQLQLQRQAEVELYDAKCELAFIRACRVAQHEPEALQQLLQLLQTGCLENNAAAASSAALALSSAQGNWQTALQLLRDMRAQGMQLTALLHRTVSSAAAAAEQSEVLAAVEACGIAAADVSAAAATAAGAKDL
jgi:hypothetical protein